MNSGSNNQQKQFRTDDLSKAIFIVNRHAKTALDSKFLYQLKHAAISKMLKEGKAKKVGLHFSRNPRFSQQQLDVLISCGDYYFHIPPTKEDIQLLENLGKLDDFYRNPKTVFPLKKAKSILQSYTGLKSPKPASKLQKTSYAKPVFKRLGE